MRDYIIFRGMDSRAVGVRITKMPSISRPPERSTSVKVPGRHGTLTLLEAAVPTYDSYTDTIEGVLLPRADADAVKAWLSGGGDLIRSTEPDRRQAARFTDAIHFEKILHGHRHRKFKVTASLQPLKYEANPSTLTYYQPGVIINPSIIESDPTITLYGDGIITLTVNGASIALTGIEGEITLDGEVGEAYRGKDPLNHRMRGSFPVFQPGHNYIEWTGTVRKVEVRPNWRWV